MAITPNDTNNRFGAKGLLNQKREENQNRRTSVNVTDSPSERKIPSGQKGTTAGGIQGNRGGQFYNHNKQSERQKENNLEKLKDALAKKDIYEFTDDEKELFIKFYPELFAHIGEVCGTAEFYTNDPIAELVLSDYFIKKERTKGMDFLFNLHNNSLADEILSD